jgi:hypothetical protein
MPWPYAPACSHLWIALVRIPKSVQEVARGPLLSSPLRTTLCLCLAPLPAISIVSDCNVALRLVVNILNRSCLRHGRTRSRSCHLRWSPLRSFHFRTCHLGQRRCGASNGTTCASVDRKTDAPQRLADRTAIPQMLAGSIVMVRGNGVCTGSGSSARLCKAGC